MLMLHLIMFGATGSTLVSCFFSPLIGVSMKSTRKNLAICRATSCLIRGGSSHLVLVTITAVPRINPLPDLTIYCAALPQTIFRQQFSAAFYRVTCTGCRRTGQIMIDLLQFIKIALPVSPGPGQLQV